jgi:hypothetical protein
VLLLADVQVLAVPGDDVGPDEAVARQPAPTHEPADPAAKREAGDSRRRNEATGERQPERLRLGVDVLPETSSLRHDAAPVRVDPDPLHR